MIYLITFACYGRHLHGSESGSVDREHNVHGTPILEVDSARAAAEEELLEQAPYDLDQIRRDAVLEAIQEVCGHRGWGLLAAHVRSTHVHMVVEAEAPPERVMSDCKVYASRRLNRMRLDRPKRNRWARHGSTQWLWKPPHVSAAIQSVVAEQGDTMSVFESRELQSRAGIRSLTVAALLYQRGRFATRLPVDRRYTPSHYWLLEESEGVWRAGFTKLATWLLGDPVEHEFSILAGSAVTVGQEIGWVEGLKALSTIFSVAEGEFLGAGDEIQSDITLIESDPYERGWLYRVRGTPAPDSLDVHAYVAVLDQTIDDVLLDRQEECGGPYAG